MIGELLQQVLADPINRFRPLDEAKAKEIEAALELLTTNPASLPVIKNKKKPKPAGQRKPSTTAIDRQGQERRLGREVGVADRGVGVLGSGS